MRDIEIKVRPRDWERVHRELARLGARDMGVETQHDIFYSCSTGRLKFRSSSRDGDMLVAYSRPDAPGLRASDYHLVPVTDRAALLRALDATLGRLGEVRKRRQLFWLDNIRVHLDEVDGLGRFLEIEAQVDDAHPEEQCREAAAALLEGFGIRPEDRLSVAYVDLEVRRED